MKIEIDDEYADEVLAAMLREIYVGALYEIKMNDLHMDDIEPLEELVIHIPPVLSYLMPRGAYEEFMQRVKEMKEND
jgi:hypothetical protein